MIRVLAVANHTPLRHGIAALLASQSDMSLVAVGTDQLKIAGTRFEDLLDAFRIIHLV